MTHPSVNSIVERKWTPEQFWEYLEAFVGEWEADTIKDAMEGFGLTVASATIISELQAENERLQRALMFWMPGVDLRLDEATREQCANDAGLLAGYSGPLVGRRWGNEIINTVADLQADIEKLKDQNAVHLNMLRGGIAKPSWRQILHLYPEEAAALSRIKAETIEALRPFADALQDVDDAAGDEWHLWESPAAMNLSVGDLRRADTAIRSLGSTGGAEKTAESDHSPSTQTTASE